MRGRSIEWPFLCLNLFSRFGLIPDHGQNQTNNKADHKMPQKQLPICFLNGESSNLISVIDRGLCYGHGLFETIRLSDAQMPLWDYHYQRLRKGAHSLSISLDNHLLQGYLDQLIANCPDNGIVKIMITAGRGDRGYRLSNTSPNYLLQWFPLSDYPRHYQRCGVTLKLCQHRLASSPQLAGIKHLNRLDQVIARGEWGDEYEEGLMLDQYGHVIEAVSGNLFFYRDGAWFTPKLDQCGVAGVMRQYIMEELCNVSLSSLSKIEEVTCLLDDLLSADEVFICNSVNGIWPVLSLENLVPGNPGLANQSSWSLGPQTLALQAALYKSLPAYLNSTE